MTCSTPVVWLNRRPLFLTSLSFSFSLLFFFLTFSSPFLSPSFFLFLLASEMLRDPVNEPEKKNPQIGQTTTDRYLTFATVCSE